MTPEYVSIVRSLVHDALVQAADDQVDAVVSYREGAGDWQRVEACIQRCRTLHAIDNELVLLLNEARHEEAEPFSLPPLDEIEVDYGGDEGFVFNELR